MKNVIIRTYQGILFGDAFGLGIEFKSRPWVLEHVHFDAFVNVWKGGKNNIHPGTYSDDGEHSIGVIEALLSDQPFSQELLLDKFKHEYETDKNRKGYPRDGHGSIEDWYKGLKTIEEVRATQASRIDPGNAPVMRSVPYSFIAKENIRPYAIINADCTHPNEGGRKGSLLSILTGWYFLREQGTPEGLISYLINEMDTMRGELESIDLLPSPDKLTESDYLILHGEQPLPYIPWDKNIYGLPCAAMKTALNAVYVLKHSRSAFDALKYSINMGGDIDSLAAVCTGIASGVYGLESLPQDLLLKTEGFERMKTLGELTYQKFF